MIAQLKTWLRVRSIEAQKREISDGYNWAAGTLLAAMTHGRFGEELADMRSKVEAAKGFDCYTLFDEGVDAAISDFNAAFMRERSAAYMREARNAATFATPKGGIDKG